MQVSNQILGRVLRGVARVEDFKAVREFTPSLVLNPGRIQTLINHGHETSANGELGRKHLAHEIATTLFKVEVGCCLKRKTTARRILWYQRMSRRISRLLPIGQCREQDAS
jgi:hypothetical protein